MTDVLIPRRVKRYGFKPSLPLFGEPFANVAGIKVLPEVDPRKDIGDWVFDQGDLGSCTANATANGFRYDAALDGHDPGVLARLWIYYYERKLEGVLGQGDTGAFGHDAFTVAKKLGIPPETDWSYDTSTFEGPVPPQATKDEKHYKLTKRVASVPQTQQAIMAVLSNKQTVAYGFSVYESFEGSDVARTGIVPMPQQGETLLGGHETLIVGYLKSEPHYALVMNSWSKQWGINGLFLMPWTYIVNRQLASDLRTITRPIAH